MSLQRRNPAFRTVRFLRNWVWKGANRHFQKGDIAEIRDWIADKLIFDGIAEQVRVK